MNEEEGQHDLFTGFDDFRSVRIRRRVHRRDVSRHHDMGDAVLWEGIATEQKTKIITCAACGAKVEVHIKAAVAKYCPACAEKFKKAAKQEYRERQKREVRGICTRCGNEFVYVFKGSERALCDDCRFKRGGRPRNSDATKRKRKKKKGPTLKEIERAANENGISYGKYRALLYMQEMKGEKNHD